MRGITSRATNGNVTHSVASTRPGTAKIIWMLFESSHGPSQPRRPNSNTKINPDITGDTANGKSISVISRLLPRKWNLEIAHAAARPNTRLRGTQINATSNVTRMAESAWRSVKLAAYT